MKAFRIIMNLLFVILATATMIGIVILVSYPDAEKQRIIELVAFIFICLVAACIVNKLLTKAITSTSDPRLKRLNRIIDRVQNATALYDLNLLCLYSQQLDSAEMELKRYMIDKYVLDELAFNIDSARLNLNRVIKKSLKK